MNYAMIWRYHGNKCIAGVGLCSRVFWVCIALGKRIGWGLRVLDCLLVYRWECMPWVWKESSNYWPGYLV